MFAGLAYISLIAIISNVTDVSISNKEENMPETDINYSVSFIYQKHKKVYYLTIRMKLGT